MRLQKLIFAMIARMFRLREAWNNKPRALRVCGIVEKKRKKESETWILNKNLKKL